ncbi:MAG TPA: ComEC/Rec2 family competence protein [Patescibacteria group bacterium]|nr:ComEC/Rec2 family competence protein [Patescibacteria group bacterium]
MFRKSQLVFYACLAFILGVGLASFVFIGWLVLYFTGLAGIIVLIFSKPKSLPFFFALCSLFFVFGLARYQLSIPKIDERHLSFYNNQPEVEFYERQSVSFKGLVLDEPDVRKDHVKLKVESRELKVGSEVKKVEGRVLIKTDLYPQYDYGDVLQIDCRLVEPEPIEDFAYEKYLALSGIYSLCYNGRIEKIDVGRGNWFKSTVFKIKAKIVQTSGQILPEPQASFLGGLLWGAKKGLPEEVLENFNKTGVTHIIAVSGYNITIIAVALTNIFIGLGLSRVKAFWLIVLGIVFFIVITGSPASIVRAGLMGLVVLTAQTVGRAAKMRNTLAVVCLLMLLFNPKILIWDAGFQLSFLATIGLIYLAPRLKKYTTRLPQTFGLRESFTTTLSAIILTAPLIIFQFGRFSFLALPANLLILPIIPLNMAVGFLAVVGGLIWLPLGQVIGYVSWIILTYVLKLTEILGGLAFASTPLPGLHWIFMAAGYLFIGFIIFKNQKRTS